jgi:Reverse transcriptase (RNA-dependent DNA polymerase)
MLCDEDCRTAGFGKTERPVGWEGNGELVMTGLMRHCSRGNSQLTDRPRLTSLSHSFTLDIICHCRSEHEASKLRKVLERRFLQCGLELHAEKTMIVYCKDTNRRRDYAIQQFDFLGYCFRPRKAKWAKGIVRNFFSSGSEPQGADKRILQLIRRWLKAGVIEDGRRQPSQKGTPQGAVISPLLANIYLHHAFDQWIQAWRKVPGRGCVIAIRYADDSVVGFEKKATAQMFLEQLQERLAKFGLALHQDKTRLIEFGRFAAERRHARGDRRPETFDFLGFTHCCGQDRQARFRVVCLTVKKRMRATLTAIREKLVRRRHEPVPTIGTWLHRVVEGYFRYHAVPTNLYRLDGFRTEVCRAWRHALRRRSQRTRMNWDRFNRTVLQYIRTYRDAASSTHTRKSDSSRHTP